MRRQQRYVKRQRLSAEEKIAHFEKEYQEFIQHLLSNSIWTVNGQPMNDLTRKLFDQTVPQWDKHCN